MLSTCDIVNFLYQVSSSFNNTLPWTRFTSSHDKQLAESEFSCGAAKEAKVTNVAPQRVT